MSAEASSDYVTDCLDALKRCKECEDAFEYINSELKLNQESFCLIQTSFVEILEEVSKYITANPVLSDEIFETYIVGIHRILREISFFFNLLAESSLSIEVGDVFPSDPYKLHHLFERKGIDKSAYQPNANQTGKSISSTSGIIHQEKLLKRFKFVANDGRARACKNRMANFYSASCALNQNITDAVKPFLKWQKETFFPALQEEILNKGLQDHNNYRHRFQVSTVPCSSSKFCIFSSR